MRRLTLVFIFAFAALNARVDAHSRGLSYINYNYPMITANRFPQLMNPYYASTSYNYRPDYYYNLNQGRVCSRNNRFNRPSPYAYSSVISSVIYKLF